MKGGLLPYSSPLSSPKSLRQGTLITWPSTRLFLEAREACKASKPSHTSSVSCVSRVRMMQFELWLNGVAEGEAVLSRVPSLALAIATESELWPRAANY